MISQTAEYALCALIYLAQRDGASCTTRETAKSTGIPADYLAKVFKELGKAGLVQSQRGLNGGYRLIRRPNELPIIEVIETVRPLRRFRNYSNGCTQSNDKLSPLHRLLDEAVDQANAVLFRVTIADLIETPLAETTNSIKHDRQSQKINQD